MTTDSVRITECLFHEHRASQSPAKFGHAGKAMKGEKKMGLTIARGRHSVTIRYDDLNRNHRNSRSL